VIPADHIPLSNGKSVWKDPSKPSVPITIGFLRTFHCSTIQSTKVWTVEEREGYGWNHPWLVRCYEGDVLVSEEKFMFERSARERFERKVEEHYNA
jgi:hypothetical protein